MSMLKAVPATSLTANDTTAQEELGQIRWESDGKAYRYVRALNLSVQKGSVCKFANSNNYQVTVSAAAALRNGFAGVGLGQISAGKYGWIQAEGYNTYLYTTSVEKADALVVSSTTNRVARELSTTTGLQVFGVAGASNSGSILKVAYLSGL